MKLLALHFGLWGFIGFGSTVSWLCFSGRLVRKLVQRIYLGETPTSTNAVGQLTTIKKRVADESLSSATCFFVVDSMPSYH